MLRIVSYNIHSGRDLFWRKRLQHMAATLKALDPEVICLQEVHQNSKFGFQAEYLKEQLQYSMAFAPSIRLADGHYGNAILTRLPPNRNAAIELPAKREKRSLQQVWLTWRGRDIAVWNTHCSLNQTSRSLQLKLLASQASMQLDTPLLILGDFNSPAVTLYPHLRDCAIEQGKENLPTLPAFRRRIDYIFASRHWHIHHYYLEPVTWSDHVPVVAELDLP